TAGSVVAAVSAVSTGSTVSAVVRPRELSRLGVTVDVVEGLFNNAIQAQPQALLESGAAGIVELGQFCIDPEFGRDHFVPPGTERFQRSDQTGADGRGVEPMACVADLFIAHAFDERANGVD